MYNTYFILFTIIYLLFRFIVYGLYFSRYNIKWYFSILPFVDSIHRVRLVKAPLWWSFFITIGIIEVFMIILLKDLFVFPLQGLTNTLVFISLVLIFLITKVISAVVNYRTSLLLDKSKNIAILNIFFTTPIMLYILQKNKKKE